MLRFCLLFFICLAGSAVADTSTSRSFLMGFTPFNHSWKEESADVAYQVAARHGDLILHHLDEGVPWPEAFADDMFTAEVENELNDRIARREPGQKVVLTATPINFARSGLADYWASEGGVERPGGWRDLGFDDPAVLQAYLNYCRNRIRRFDPDYFGYAIEANLLAYNNPQAFAEFLPFARQVHATLKREFPGVPVFASVYIGIDETRLPLEAQVVPLLSATDLIAVSTYPYMRPDGPTRRVDQIPADWFARVRALAPDKPFAIAETGFLAEPMRVRGIKFESSPAAQAAYVTWMLAEANRLDARFVVWFVPIDYDELWGVLRWMVMFEPLFRVWKDTGLYDGNLRPRPALSHWDRWRALPVKR